MVVVYIVCVIFQWNFPDFCFFDPLKFPPGGGGVKKYLSIFSAVREISRTFDPQPPHPGGGVGKKKM